MPNWSMDKSAEDWFSLAYTSGSIDPSGGKCVWGGGGGGGGEGGEGGPLQGRGDQTLLKIVTGSMRRSI